MHNRPVDQPTVQIYEEMAASWQAARGGPKDDLGLGLRAEVGKGLVVDLGCGTGRYLGQLDGPVVGLDAAREMLSLAARQASYPLVRADLESLPFRTGSLAGAFARHSYLHLPASKLTAALAELRRALSPGGRLFLSLIEGSYEGRQLHDDDFPGRYFTLWTAERLLAVLEEAGFLEPVVEQVAHPQGGDLWARARA